MSKLNKCALTMLLTLFCFPSLLRAANVTEFEVPKQTIQGAEVAIALGEMVDLSISPMDKKPPHLSSVTYDWKVFDGTKEKRVKKVDNGVFFGAGLVKKRLFSVCIITYLYTVKDDKGVITEVGVKTAFLSSEIVIGDAPGPGPDPTPPNPVPPVPPPTPEPDFPDGDFKLAKFVYRAAGLEVKSATARTKGAMALKNSFQGVAAAIAAGTMSKPDEILKATKEANDKALQRDLGSVSDWEEFSKVLQEYLYELYKGKKLLTKDQYQTAWKEIALGLSKVK